ncbi:DUF4123 domain-containing protein, partial [Morganella morganii]
TTTWRTWIANVRQGDVYFLLNRLAHSDPTNLFYHHNWIDEAVPLYAGTPLSHLGTAGPWLIRAKWQAFSGMAEILDTVPFSDDSWGWAYHSEDSWENQTAHWQKYQLIEFEGEERVLRLFDPRVAAVLIPACKPADWSSLLRPLADCCIPSLGGNTILNRPLDTSGTAPYRLFVPGAHLIGAWNNSEQSHRNMVDNFYIQFWEEYPELAFKLDEPHGCLHTLINDYMNVCKDDLINVAWIDNDYFIRYLTKHHLINEQTGITDAT